jgi:hypothetical protein
MLTVLCQDPFPVGFTYPSQGPLAALIESVKGQIGHRRRAMTQLPKPKRLAAHLPEQQESTWDTWPQNALKTGWVAACH